MRRAGLCMMILLGSVNINATFYDQVSGREDIDGLWTCLPLRWPRGSATLNRQKQCSKITPAMQSRTAPC